MCMPSFSTASFEHHFPRKEFGTHRRNPAQQLIAVFFVFVRKLLPRPPEILSRRLLSFPNQSRVCEARNAATNGKPSQTSRALKCARHDLDPIFFLDGQQTN